MLGGCCQLRQGHLSGGILKRSEWRLSRKPHDSSPGFGDSGSAGAEFEANPAAPSPQAGNGAANLGPDPSGYQVIDLSLRSPEHLAAVENEQPGAFVNPGFLEAS